ncbi:MAG: COP23 domain-containing protein [Cyanobacteriota bacterium]|nr:COP23 domain-containing protein [Cyanobacteriota bacterium]
MKLHSLTKLLLATPLLFGVTAAISQPARAEDNTSIVCIDRSPDSKTECKRSLQSCDTHPDNSCQEEHPGRVERREHRQRLERREHRRRVERREHPRGENRQRIGVSHKFYCESGENDVPTTFVQTRQGTYPVIRWVSDYFTPHGYDQMTRCRQVSDKFQTYFNDGNLNYVTTGVVNHQPVVCVSDTNGGTCQGVLFTLKPGQNASRVIQQLFDIRSGAASGPLLESGSRVYLDLNQHIEDAIFNTETGNSSLNSGDRW